jgi:hypothetical protein
MHAKNPSNVILRIEMRGSERRNAIERATQKCQNCLSLYELQRSNGFKNNLVFLGYVQSGNVIGQTSVQNLMGVLTPKLEVAQIFFVLLTFTYG